MPHTAREHARRFGTRLMTPQGVIVGAALVLALFWALAARVLYAARQDAYGFAEKNARNLVLVIERDIARNIELYDLSLQAAGEGIADPAVMALPPRLRDALLFDRAATGRYLGTIYVLNARGDIVLASRGGPALAGNFAHTPAFAFHRDHPRAGLFVSRPFASPFRDDGTVIGVSRRITRADGSFGGVVVGTIGVDYFRALLDGLSIGPNGSAAVFETSGALIMRLPDGTADTADTAGTAGTAHAAQVGLDIRGSALYRRAMASDEGAFTGTALVDDTQRLYVYKRVRGLPIVVDVAQANADIYAKWRIRAIRVALLLALLTPSIGVGAFLLARELRWRQRMELRLQRLARTDALTGLSNRGAFDDTLRVELARAARTGRPLSLLFVDIDQFKRYNDYYGHLAGDDVLKAVGRCLTACARRPSDDVARYGGEEFVVTLPDTDAEGAAGIAEAIRSAVYDLDIDHERSPFGRVTVSIGLVTSREGDHEVRSDASLVSMADAALYRAKSAGRNRVCEAQAA